MWIAENNIIFEPMKETFPTDRQIKIIQMVADDTTQAEIAVKLSLSVLTIEEAVKKIRLNTGIRSLPAICVLFYKKDWIK